MLRLKQVQRDWFNIVDDCGSMVGATLEDLHSFNDEIVKQTGMFSHPKKKAETKNNKTNVPVKKNNKRFWQFERHRNRSFFFFCLI